ncbi:S1 RNA-binding domain-containing protein [Paenibacillus sp. IITD108]|uniref:S1 RNA-binding domain-containing protein n=1 Tax=Paenibacillus sp. IITD108 TaxID=3116649 RepID=UPI002F42E8E2
MSLNQHVLEILRESMVRKWVQYGKVEQIKSAIIKGKKEEVVIINFQNVNLYCKKEDFVDRNVASLNGFVHTKVPFIVTSLNEDYVLVSRLQAIPKVVNQFLANTRQGDHVRGVVTGVLDTNVVFLDVDGFPCIIPAAEWDVRKIRNLKDILPIGAEVEAKVLEIRKEENLGTELREENTDEMAADEQELAETKSSSSREFGYRVILSRKDVIVEGKERFWDDIEEHHNIGDKVAVTITGKAPGNNSYYCELPTGITLIGNLASNLRNKYYSGLPSGVVATAEITRLDKETKRGRVLIFKLEANHAAMMSNAFNFI